MTINQLEKELKENKLSSIYLLYGQERYLLDNVVKKIKKSFGNLVDGLNYIKIDNSAIDKSFLKFKLLHLDLKEN